MMFANKVVLVTGATRGIGLAIAHAFVQEGAMVIGTYLRGEAAAEALENACQAGTLKLYKGSVIDGTCMCDLATDITKQYGNIDILVNNAGIARDNFITQMTDEEWDDVFSTNFLGTYNCTQAVLPHMVRQGWGKIVNMISVTGVFGREAQVNYGTSKGCIIGLTRLLARQYGPRRIHVNALSPGMTSTEMLTQVPQSKIQNFVRFTSLKRVAEPEEVARATLFLSHSNSDYLTGAVIKMDGGFMR